MMGLMTVSKYRMPPDAIDEKFAKMEKRIRALESGARANFLSIGRGGISVNDGGNIDVNDGGSIVVRGGSIRIRNTADTQDIVYFGPIDQGGLFSNGWVFHRDKTPLSLAFSLSGTPGDQYWALYDEANNIVVSDDAAAGQGLATPYILHQFASQSQPTDKNTTTTFQTLQVAEALIKQHPRLRMAILQETTSTTAEYRVRRVGGSVLHGPILTSTGFGLEMIEFTLPGAHMEEMEIVVEGRVVSGAGAIGIRVMSCYGKQT